MSHVRTQIREAILARLKAAATAAGDSVFDGLAPSIPSESLPCVAVRTPGEIVQTDDSGLSIDGTEQRIVTAYVDVFHSRITDSQTALDALVVQVEKALVAARSLTLLSDLQLVSSAVLFNTEDGALQFGCTRLEYRVTYRIDASDPETPV